MLLHSLYVYLVNENVLYLARPLDIGDRFSDDMYFDISLNFWYKWNTSIDAILDSTPPMKPGPLFKLNSCLQQHSKRSAPGHLGSFGKTLFDPIYCIIIGSKVCWE